MIAVSVPAAAQSTGAVEGRVVDATGLPLPGVTIQVVSPAPSTPRRITTTNERGEYRLLDVTPGSYELTFTAMNFAEVRRRHVVLASTRPSEVHVTLHLAATAAVVVTGRATFRNLADLPNPAESLVGVAHAASEGAVTSRQIEARPMLRAGEVLEAVPGVIVSQHSGEGKANQYYLRGFNLDHGTDFSTTVAGVPVNLPTHAHGHGYTDLNFLIPELVSGVQFRKGPYFAEDGDFSAAGSATIAYLNVLDQPILSASVGQFGWGRFMAAASPRVGAGHVLGAIELTHHDGPWDRPDDYARVNGVFRYSQGTTQNGFSVTALAYHADWRATDQIPDRAVEAGLIGRFGLIDDTSGGRTARYNVAAEYQRTTGDALTRVTGFASRYRLNLFSNFTYALGDPERGDQFEQADRRWIAGGRATHKRLNRFGTRLGETTVGAEWRHDRIPLVGLYRTQATQRLATVREDAVAQTSAAVFAEHSLRWAPWLRTIVGARADRYHFDVTSNDPANTGRETDALISPKGGVVLGPWRDTELYLNAGRGFHSNDARGTTISRDPATGDPADRVTPLAPATGVEFGFRSVAIPRMQTTVAVWRLDVASELLFIGDAGSTDVGRPSRRAGVEWSTYVSVSPSVTIDADLSWSRARFRDDDLSGASIPGAAGAVASVGVTVARERGAFGSVRVRFFGPRPLVEDNHVRSRATSLLNVQAGYHLTPRAHLVLDLFNVLDARASDIDYYYTSRLPGEPAEGVDDVHSHPTMPRSARLVLRYRF
jgi:hypothetical protein